MIKKTFKVDSMMLKESSVSEYMPGIPRSQVPSPVSSIPPQKNVDTDYTVEFTAPVTPENVDSTRH